MLIESNEAIPFAILLIIINVLLNTSFVVKDANKSPANAGLKR